MKKLLLILLCLPMIGFGQQTYVPDNNFEAYLEANGMGNGIANDDSVLTANINTIDSLTIGSLNISDLTGIEDFTYLSYLVCWDNQLTSLNLTQNTILNHLSCESNQLTNLDVSQNNALNFLGCSANNLIGLDVSQNPLLTTLFCDINQITSLDLSNNLQLYYLVSQNNQLTSLDLRNGNNTNFSYCAANNNSDLYCINVDDPAYSNANWPLGNNFDPQQYFSNNCPIANINCSDSLLITDVIIDNTNLTMNIAIYNGYNSFLNYPHVAFTVDANGDTIQTGNMNLFGAFNYDTTWYNYSISSPSLFPTYPLTSYFVYTSSLTFMSDTCVLIYNSTPTTILYPSYNNEKEIIKVIDLLGRETNQTNQPLFYIYNDGTVEKRIVIE